MKLSDLLKTIESVCETAVADEAKRLADDIRNSTPASRVQTRQAVRVRRNGTNAKILLQFPKQYASQDTPTHKRFRTQWERLRPIGQRRLIMQLTNEINKVIQSNNGG